MKYYFFGLAAAAVVASPSAVADTADWVRIHNDEEGEFFYDRDSLRRSGERVRVTMRVLLPAARAGGSYIVDYDFDCAGQTSAILAAREFGPGGEALRSMVAPADRVRAEPLVAGTPYEPIYRAICPSGAALPPPPPPGPPLIATPPGTTECDCTDPDSPD